jgi:hypothetical protein
MRTTFAGSCVGDCSLPKELKDFRDYHRGAIMVVCGCGVSLKTLVNPERYITIGVNDVGRLFQPDYLVVVNPRNQFQGDRFRYVEESRARAIFTQLDLGLEHPHVVRFNLGKRAGTDFSDPNSLNYTSNSPYVALSLAVHMGAGRVGVIGVDFANDHFFAPTGAHPLEPQLAQIDQEYKRLYEECVRREVAVFNLSPPSRLTAFPKLSLEEFLPQANPQPAQQIVSYSTMPVAGVPALLARCIAARTEHACRTVWARNSYGNGVTFQGDVEWEQAPSEAEGLLRSADLVIAHNGKIDPRHVPLLADTPILTMAHNYMWNVNPSFVQQGYPGVVVGQYQAALPEFRQWLPVPNPVPLWEAAFRPGPKHAQLTICFTPSGKHEAYPAEHPLYWHSKGYDTTLRVLERLAQRFSLRLEVIRSGQVSHAESLGMKRNAHIVIDECVTGSYHRNSLEGLALGCVVVNGMGRVPAIVEVFRHCAGGTAEIPFVRADLPDLERVLTSLIEQGTEALASQGWHNRAWMEQHWDFQRQWKRFWQPVVDQATQAGRPRVSCVDFAPSIPPAGDKSMSYEKAANELKEGLSVVVCHGGNERLPHLTASLANLRQCAGVNEIIVVDMGVSPFAENDARRWADKYFFVRNEDVFERARTLNVGTALAEYDLVLWIDNDLIMAPDFIGKAVTEMRATQLDYLIPYTRINYLSEPDSEAVLQGTRNPGDCPVMGVYLPLRAVCGGAGIVKRSFVLAYGGMSEDFRGWGGEDDAWWHKATLLGRAAATQRKDQHLYHLFHPNSGASGGTGQWANNPHYSRNLAVLKEMRSIRDRNTFMKRFPPASKLSCGWEEKRIRFIGHTLAERPDCAIGDVARALEQLAHTRVECRFTNNGHFEGHDLLSEQPDSTVIFGSSLATSFLSDASAATLWPKSVVVHTGGELTEKLVQQLRLAGAIMCMNCEEAEPLMQAGLRPWNGMGGGSHTSLRSTLTLIQPLSIILGGATPSAASAASTGEVEQGMSFGEPATNAQLPVWMYWEGPCPEWVKHCQRTVFRHAREVRLLSADDFEKLWDVDRDIDLKRLHAAQRADYIRAFLLARYGGLWIDSDCIVMRPLQPLLDVLNEFEFIAHRERHGGFWANDFMGAARGSKLASALYQGICKTLRTPASVGWTALGCVALTETLKAANASWFEIKSERIQPVCWSNPDPFFAVRDAAGHQQILDQRAMCYMLSNLTMQKQFQVTDLSPGLLSEGTFFNYLIRSSLNEERVESTKSALSESRSSQALMAADLTDLGTSQPMEEVFSRMVTSCSQAGLESLSGPGSSLLSTSEIRQRLPLLIQDLRVKSLLDAGCGDLNWMRRLELAVEEYVGVDVVPSLIQGNRKNFGGNQSRFLALDLARQRLPKADLILCRDCLVHFSYADIFLALQNFKKSSSKYLLTTTFEALPANTDISTGGWRPVNFQRPPFSFPRPLRIINEKCTEAGGRYSDKSLALWKLADLPVGQSCAEDSPVCGERKLAEPNCSQPSVADHTVQVSQAMVKVFRQMAASCSRAGYESCSGPGSSLLSTAVIRAELLRLIRELRAQSLLDAPCGDFNWMKHVINGELGEYIGVDVIPELIEQNQRSFGAPHRRFLNLDITCHQLPRVDLILCRDCLGHFSFKHIVDAIRSFKNSQSRYLLTTTFPNRQTNRDIATGDWQPLNLQAYPFNFPAPLRIVNEKCTENAGRYADKSLALWDLASLP